MQVYQSYKDELFYCTFYHIKYLLLQGELLLIARTLCRWTQSWASPAQAMNVCAGCWTDGTGHWTLALDTREEASVCALLLLLSRKPLTSNPMNISLRYAKDCKQ